jgi:hypothetical protein
MGSPLSSEAEEIRILFRGRPQRTSTEGGTSQGKLGDDPENWANITLASVQSQFKMWQRLIHWQASARPDRTSREARDRRALGFQLFRSTLHPKCGPVRNSGNASLFAFDRISAAWDNFCFMGLRINALDHPASS